MSSYPTLNLLQLEAIEASCRCGCLVQIQPNKDVDSEQVYEIWSGRVQSTAELVPMGFLEEKPIEGDEIIATLKEQHPNREFRMFVPTELAQQMFNNPLYNSSVIH